MNKHEEDIMEGYNCKESISSMVVRVLTPKNADADAYATGVGKDDVSDLLSAAVVYLGQDVEECGAIVRSAYHMGWRHRGSPVNACYVGMCRACGKPFALIMDNPEHTEVVAGEVAQAIRDGGYIERREVPADIESVEWCNCK
jgi:hypothetical protein